MADDKQRKLQELKLREAQLQCSVKELEVEIALIQRNLARLLQEQPASGRAVILCW